MSRCPICRRVGCPSDEPPGIGPRVVFVIGLGLAAGFTAWGIYEGGYRLVALIYGF